MLRSIPAGRAPEGGEEVSVVEELTVRHVPPPQDELAGDLRIFVPVAATAAAFCAGFGLLHELLGMPARMGYVVALAHVLNLLAFRLWRSVSHLVSSTCAATMIGAVAMQYDAGGFSASGAMSLWAAAGPLAAAVMWRGYRLPLWLGAFVLCVGGEALCERFFPVPMPVEKPAWLSALLFVCNLVGLTLVASLSLSYLVRERTRANDALVKEHQRSERLLRNVLPVPVIERLKRSRRPVAERLDATILFADIVGFTELSRRTTPEELVQRLDELFSHFDRLVERFGLEKIKTIGDAYMVAGGVPEPREDHLRATVQLGLEMLRVVASSGRGLRVRIGIHTGPVVAGIIGRKKFAYDVWGDVVNMASRMESHGEVNAIHVSQAVVEQLGTAFPFEERGLIPLKGLGETRTWLLRSASKHAA